MNATINLNAPQSPSGVKTFAWRAARSVRDGVQASLFKQKYGFRPPPKGTDVSTKKLLRKIAELKCFSRPGDVVEIGAFLGGGTYTLANVMARTAPEKRLYTIDIFDPTFDVTPCLQGIPMATLYQKTLAGRSQEEIFREVTKDCKNLTVVKGDSKQIQLPTDKVCFAYIDGNHEYSYVKHDFELVWPKVVSGGVIAFDDYAFDIPEVTLGIHELIGEHASSIKRIDTRTSRTIFIQKM